MNPATTRVSIGLLLLASLSGGCGSGSPSDAAARPAIDETVTIEKSAVPARYSAPLPTSVASLQAWLKGNPAIAPVAHVVENIAGGDAAWLARLNTAASAVPTNEQRAWAKIWHGLFEFETTDAAFCAQARTLMSGPPGAARSAIAGVFARSCAKPADTPLVLRADTPYWAILEFFDPWSGGGETAVRRPFDPRLVAAAREAILAHRGLEARRAAFTLVEQRNASADAALLAIHAEIRDQEHADEVAMAFREARDDEAMARRAEACARRPDDAACTPDTTLPAGQPTAAQPPVAAAAVKARIAQLSAMGFNKVGAVNVAEMDTDAAEMILLAAGHVHWFDVETSMYPNQHDSLMRSLARLVAPALEGAVFEERPPADDGSLPYRLLAYADGKLYRTEAEDLDDWYDVDAVLRLMNAIMEDRKASARFANLASTDQTMMIVGAPSESIAKAVREGLLDLGDAREAERIGKAFEERVLKSLQN